MHGVGRIIVWVIIITLLWASSMAGFALYISLYPKQQTEKADAIIVFTGGTGRVQKGLELLASGQGRSLFISGVGKNIPMGDVLAQGSSLISSFFDSKITLGRSAVNTVGNAEETAQWLDQHKYHSVLLVTSDYHMPRAIAELRALMHHTITIIPVTIKTRNYLNPNWVMDAEARNMIFFEFHKFIGAKLRHFFIKADKSS